MTEWEIADLIRWEHGKDAATPKLPPDTTPETVEQVKANRSQILKMAMDRYMRVPPPNAWFVKQIPPRLQTEKDRIMAYAMGQTNEVTQWINQQAQKTSSLEAACDLIAWQQCHRRNPLAFVLSLD